MFLDAKPIFPVGKAEEMNTLAAFRTTLDDIKGTSILITASTFYQLWVNGNFVAFGPARTAKGYTRVDVHGLDGYAKDGENEIVVLVMGYACRSLSTVMSKSFLQAEICRDGEVLRASGRDFEAYLPPQRVQKVHKYSYQRHFSEVWDFGEGLDFCLPKYKTDVEVISPALTAIQRRAPYAYYEDILADKATVKGTLKYNEELPYVTLPFNQVNKNSYFEASEVKHNPYEWIQRHEQIKMQCECKLPINLLENEYVIFDFLHLETGFIKLLAKVKSDADIVVGFSEYSSEDKFKYVQMGAINAVEILSKGGESLDFTSFEPYVGRFFIVAVKKGEIELQSFGIKTFIHSPSGALIAPPENPELKPIHDAAVRTFLQNAVDIYMDCPSRERAGWLCDSYFMGKAEYALFGNSMVEEAFLENYRLFKNDGGYPENTIPMCYPSDVRDPGKNTVIPQWTMWYILQIEEYVNARGHASDAPLFRESIDYLLKFYEKHENSDGLLEDLPYWNVIEWSGANNWSQNVSYPTNFLYAGVLEACYKMYGDVEFLKKADAVRSKIIEQSFDGVRFYDHSVRDEDGKLVLQNHCSEIAQYFAILFGGFDIEDKKYESLKTLVTMDCVKNNPDFPSDMEPINAFIGIPLRIETLLKIKAYDLVLQEVAAYYGPMAEKTGTLWEMLELKASLNHGFGSYALVAINRALNKN